MSIIDETAVEFLKLVVGVSDKNYLCTCIFVGLFWPNFRVFWFYSTFVVVLWITKISKNKLSYFMNLEILFNWICCKFCSMFKLFCITSLLFINNIVFCWLSLARSRQKHGPLFDTPANKLYHELVDAGSLNVVNTKIVSTLYNLPLPNRTLERIPRITQLMIIHYKL